MTARQIVTPLPATSIHLPFELAAGKPFPLGATVDDHALISPYFPLMQQGLNCAYLTIKVTVKFIVLPLVSKPSRYGIAMYMV